jgi:membrane protein
MPKSRPQRSKCRRNSSERSLHAAPLGRLGEAHQRRPPISRSQAGSGSREGPFKQFKHDDVTDRAAALTYYGLLAPFPAVLMLISLLRLAGRPTIQKFLNNIEQVAPSTINSFLRTVIEQVQGRSGAASIPAIVGLALAVWSASGCVAGSCGRPMPSTTSTKSARYGSRPPAPARDGGACRHACNQRGHGDRYQPIASQVGKVFGIGNSIVIAWHIAKWPILLVSVSLTFSLLYWACPNVKQPGFKWITPGGVIAVISWLIAFGSFALYVSRGEALNLLSGQAVAVEHDGHRVAEVRHVGEDIHLAEPAHGPPS